MRIGFSLPLTEVMNTEAICVWQESLRHPLPFSTGTPQHGPTHYVAFSHIWTKSHSIGSPLLGMFSEFSCRKIYLYLGLRKQTAPPSSLLCGWEALSKFPSKKCSSEAHPSVLRPSFTPITGEVASGRALPCRFSISHLLFACVAISDLLRLNLCLTKVGGVIR